VAAWALCTAAVKVKNQRRFRIIRAFTIGWVAALVFLAIVRGSGTVEEGSAEFGQLTAISLSVIFGVVFGVIAGIAQILIEERIYRRVGLGKLLAVRALAAISLLVLINLAGYVAVTTMRDVSIGFLEFVTEPGSFAIFFYLLCVDTFLVALRQVNLLLGEGKLLKLIRGAFYTPREEERIFMFLDLRSSTTLAEALGHVKYSMLIQDCFDDLGVVAEHGAEIYQYVGDGVVLTWPLEEGIKDGNCLAAYYRFRERLTERDEHYETSYQVQPVFTAGVNAGVVTVTEVGKLKREIAYHGDAINTAARIEGQCKERGQELLISGALAERLRGDKFGLRPLGSISLRGKEEEVSVVVVSSVA